MRRVRRRGRVHEGVDGEGKERERKVSEWAVKVFFFLKKNYKLCQFVAGLGYFKHRRLTSF